MNKNKNKKHIKDNTYQAIRLKYLFFEGPSRFFWTCFHRPSYLFPSQDLAILLWKH